LKYIAGGDGRAILFFNTFTNNFENPEGKFDTEKAIYLLNAMNYIDATKNGYSQNDIPAEFTDFIIIMAIVHRIVQRNDIATADAAIGVQMFKTILKNVYGKWNSLDKNVQNFYKRYFNFKTAGGANVLETKYEEQAKKDLGTDTIELIEKDYSVWDSTAPGVKNDVKVPLIIDLIPKIPKYASGSNEIFASIRQKKVISAAAFSENDLKTLYALAYSNKGNYLPLDEFNKENKDADFDEIIKLGKVANLGDRLKLFGNKPKEGFEYLPTSRRSEKIGFLTRKEEQEKEEQVKLSKELCEQMIIDMGVSTGKIWNVDENGKRFHLKDGNKIYESDVILEVCDNGTPCKNFVDQCLLRGNECENEFEKQLLNLQWKGQKIFDNGKFNLDMFPPMLLVRILYVLGFPYKTLGETYYVQSYDYWKKNILPEFEKDSDKKWIYTAFSSKNDDDNKVKLIKKIIECINADKTILNPKLKRVSVSEFPQKQSTYYPIFKQESKSPLVFMYGGAYERSIYNYSYVDPFQYQLGYSFVQPNGSMLKDSGLSGSNYLKRQWSNAINLAKNNGITISNKNQIDNELGLFSALEKDLKQQILYTHEYVKLTKNTERGKYLKQDNISTREIAMNLGEFRKKETNLAKLISNALSELGSALKDKEEKVVRNSLGDIINVGW
jgi:hypothetical protein